MLHPIQPSVNDPVHQHAVQALAAETRVSVEHVGDIYAAELAQLTVNARVRDYLPILTSRRVRVILLERQKSG